VAADGSSITFLPAPNITDQSLVITNVISAASPGLPFSPSTVQRITTPAITEFDGTVSSLAPPANQPVTISLNNATLDPAGAVITVGADTAVLIGATANTATFIPKPGGTGLVFFSGVVIDSLPQFSLTLTNAITDTLHVGAVGTAAGTNAPGTAPSLAVPDPGFAAPFFDAADFDASADHFYKLVVPAAGDYTITLNWDIGSDLDMFLCPSPGTITGACDFQAATGNQPEQGIFTLTPGTYYVVAEDFGGDAHLSNNSITVAR
jgi:hypothetical protein